MFAILQENLVELHQVPRLLPKHRGRRRHLRTITRWCDFGVAGAKLENVSIGRTRYTSREAIDRFLYDLTSRRQHLAVV